MNYMINDSASKQVAIEFAKWVVISRIWQSDLTFEEMYGDWINGMESVAELEAEDDEIRLR